MVKIVFYFKSFSFFSCWWLSTEETYLIIQQSQLHNCGWIFHSLSCCCFLAWHWFCCICWPDTDFVLSQLAHKLKAQPIHPFYPFSYYLRCCHFYFIFIAGLDQPPENSFLRAVLFKLCWWALADAAFYFLSHSAAYFLCTKRKNEDHVQMIKFIANTTNCLQTNFTFLAVLFADKNKKQNCFRAPSLFKIFKYTCQYKYVLISI